MEGASVVSPAGKIENEKEVDAPFYMKAASYWSGIPATIDGMLGGFGFVSSIDIKTSSNFLKALSKTKTPPGKKRALDCGAGIGRISKYLLLERFEKVDLVEQNPAFLEQAASFIGVNRRLGNMFCSGLQNFTPEPNTYDVIWCQWVLMHLTDEDLTKFLHKCKIGLKPNGVIVVKENVTGDGNTELDDTDSSVTRSLADLRSVLESNGLRCIRVKKQERFPQLLYPVYMFALRPVQTKIKQDIREKLPEVNKVSEDTNQASEDKETAAHGVTAENVVANGQHLEESASELCDLEDKLRIGSQS